MKTPILIPLSLCCLAVSQFAVAQTAERRADQRPVIPRETLAKLDAHTDLIYARYGKRELKLDLYRPKDSSSPLPAIICIHGGGWSQGTNASMRTLAQAIAARGFVAVSIEYRHSGEQKFPAQIHDCKAAVRWLRANAAKFRVDAKHIGVTGHSAGGHLAALLATSGGVKELEGDGGNADQSSAVQACVAMGAQSDLETDRIRRLSSKPENQHYPPFLGGSLDAVPKVYALASPRHHLDKSDPPLAFVTGELDDPSTHGDDIRRDMMKLGIATELTVILKEPHAFLPSKPAFDLAVNTCADFFAKHLRSP